MYSLTSANRYYLYLGFVRMNLGIDGLFKIIRSQMKELSPISGDVFLFFGKNRQSVKILRWSGRWLRKLSVFQLHHERRYLSLLAE